MTNPVRRGDAELALKRPAAQNQAIAEAVARANAIIIDARRAHAASKQREK